MGELEKSGHLQPFRTHENTLLVVLDGVTYHSSTTIHCAECLHREDKQGVLHDYHSANAPVIVHPHLSQVLPLPPELSVPQDGHEKQECERAAVKRWLARQAPHDAPGTITYLGDDWYANQPLCQQIAETAHPFFVFVCKPDSHPTLQQELALRETVAGVTTLVQRHWTGRQAERWTYRFATHLPLRTSCDALLVNWLELTITTEKSGTLLFHNAWITNHGLTAQTVVALAQVGRTRWKIENEAINVLKNHRYPLEHTLGFDVSRGPGGANGHGQNHRSTFLFSLNLRAFLTHTPQHLVDDPYRLLRQTLAVHRTFCPDLKALTRYILFESWDALFAFRVDGLELAIPPP